MGAASCGRSVHCHEYGSTRVCVWWWWCVRGTLVLVRGAARSTGTQEVVDPAAEVTATVVLAPAYAVASTVVSAWVRAGGGAQAPLAVTGGTTVTVTVPAGGLLVVGLQLA